MKHCSPSKYLWYEQAQYLILGVAYIHYILLVLGVNPICYREGGRSCKIYFLSVGWLDYRFESVPMLT